MKVAVTGGSGKLGQWVVRELVEPTEDGVPHEVTVLDLIAGPPHEAVRYLVGDVQDLGQVVGALAGADAVIHEAAWRLGIRRVVSTSSVAPLGFDFRDREFLPDYLPFDEDHPLRPQDAYGLSKEVGEAIARSYTAKCGMETVILRPPGLMTPEQMEEIRRAGGRPVTRFALYSYVDLRDLAKASRLAIERPLDGCHVLFVAADDSGVAEPLADLYPRLLPSLGDRARALTSSQPSVSNVRAKAVLGWQPKHSWRRADEGDDLA